MKHLLKIMNQWVRENDSEYRKRPWSIGGYTYSANGACALRIPGEHGVYSEFPSVDVFDWTSLDGDDCTYLDPVRLKKIASSNPCGECRPDLGIGEEEIKTCDACEGEGKYECGECGHDVECNYCDGIGHLVVATPRSECRCCLGTGVHRGHHSIGDRDFNIVHLMLLSNNFPNLRFYKESEPVKDAIGFRFGGNGMGALMRMR